MWVRFEKDFRFKPTSQTAQRFAAGTEHNVPQTCAEMAMQAGAAVALKRVRGKSVETETEKPAGA